ncbi:tyrosine-type recombinase/integrase [Streptomyces chrestomyceticus]|uniref:tyrosine-type recombinase/integrase n=1 Tax=Streptomyces chrestomyceticus TaxID=68185 RepID=UPI00340CD06B
MVKAATDGRYPVRVSGPLALSVHPFRLELMQRGFTPRSSQDHAYILADLSRWLEREGLGPGQLTAERVGEFVQARRDAGHRRWLTDRSLRLVLGFLRDAGAIPPQEHGSVGSPVEGVLEKYRSYLLRERRLGERTVRGRVDVARRFLTAQLVEDRLRLEKLSPESVAGFVLDTSKQYATGTMKGVTSSLRTLLRFLFVTAAVDRDLAGAVPSVAGWRLSRLPSSTDAVPFLLGSCDRTTKSGRRDFAILLLMVRLGLRAVEVSRLCLQDVDWRAGELVVRGKNGRVDRMPLPADVGTALADWLRHGRRPSAFREVFLRTVGPDAPMARQSVVMVPRCASLRAGIPVVAAHQLRHRAACQVLAGGGTLGEAAQLLRHHGEDSTAIYAKVDMAALAPVVRPWPTADER